MTKRKKVYCCICGKEIKGYGNNPWPVKDKGLCCDECNLEVVIPTRLGQFYNRNKWRA